MLKYYLIHEDTVGNFIEYCSKVLNDNSDKAVIYSYTCKPREYTDEQKEIQTKCGWLATPTIWVRMHEHDTIKTIEQMVKQLVVSKYRGDLHTKALQDFLGSKVYIVLEHEDDDNKRYGSAGVQVYYEKQENLPEIITDKQALIDVLDNDYNRHYRNGEYEKVYIESFSAKVDYYTVRYAQEADKYIKRYVKSALPYCLKQGKSIVPDEYLDKGEQGIEEYIAIKRSSNKNNSIEKQLVKQTLNDKKERAKDIECGLFSVITNSQSTDWTMPHLEIDGRWNKARINKHVVHMLGVDKSAILKMTDDDIVNKVKEEWKKVLMDAYNAVDNYNPNN